MVLLVIFLLVILLEYWRFFVLHLRINIPTCFVKAKCGIFILYIQQSAWPDVVNIRQAKHIKNSLTRYERI